MIGEHMKKTRKHRGGGDMLLEYDFRGGERGKYAQRYAEGCNVVVLAPEVAEVFPDSRSVNDAASELWASEAGWGGSGGKAFPLRGVTAERREPVQRR